MLRMIPLPLALLLATVVLAEPAAAASSSAASSSSSSGGGRSSAQANDDSGGIETDERGCRVIRHPGTPSTSIQVGPNGQLSGSTSAGGSGAWSEAGGGKARSGCTVVVPEGKQ